MCTRLVNSWDGTYSDGRTRCHALSLAERALKKASWVES